MDNTSQAIENPSEQTVKPIFSILAGLMAVLNMLSVFFLLNFVFISIANSSGYTTFYVVVFLVFSTALLGSIFSVLCLVRKERWVFRIPVILYNILATIGLAILAYHELY